MTDNTHNPDELARIVMLVFGTMREGTGSYWCYVAIKPTEYRSFMARHQEGSINLYDFESQGFGEIIVSGKGRTPPTEVTYQVAQVYKLNIDELYKETDGEKALEKKILQFNAPKNTTEKT